MLVAQSCPTLCNPMDYNLPGSSAHGILQARILEWVVGAIPFSRGSYPNPGTEPGSPALQADSLPSEPYMREYQHKEEGGKACKAVIFPNST